MFKTHNPIPGYWYSNRDGLLIQVRAKVYTKEVITAIVLEDIASNVTYVTPAEWVEMDLTLHSPVTASQSAG